MMGISPSGVRWPVYTEAETTPCWCSQGGLIGIPPICTGTCMYVCMYVGVCMHVCVCVCMCVCLCVCV
jgi:hypothetical protein